MISSLKKIKLVAIDGPAGSGKSTIASVLAKRLNWVYCNTGAMYRCLAFLCLKEKKVVENTESFIHFIKQYSINFKEQFIYIDNKDVSALIRTPEVDRYVSLIAALPLVRDYLVEKQRVIAQKGSVVMEGRDIGSVVCPDAEYKFYLEASLEERASRRFRDYQHKGKDISLDTIKEDLLKRDKKDSTRAASPLIVSSDAHVIDTSNKTIDDVLDLILSYIKD